MKRAVITGFGIISSIGNNKEEVLASLKAGKSGIEVVPEFIEMKMRSHVAGTIKLDPSEHIPIVKCIVLWVMRQLMHTFLCVKRLKIQV